MKYIKLILILILGINFSNLFAQKKAKHNIVFQYTNASDTLQQKAFLNQLENITEYWPKAKYEVVIYNQGVELVFSSNAKYHDRLFTLKQKGVRFVVCENTLKNRKIPKESLQQDIVEFVPAGIAEIVEKQEKGWSYIKGGF